MKFIACLDMSHHGTLHPFRETGVVVDSLTVIHSVMPKCVFVTGAAYTNVLKCLPRQKFRGVKSGKNRGHVVCPLPIGRDRCHNNTHSTTGRMSHWYGIHWGIDRITYQKIGTTKMEAQQLPSNKHLMWTISTETCSVM
jgi:hypothetical protein